MMYEHNIGTLRRILPALEYSSAILLEDGFFDPIGTTITKDWDTNWIDHPALKPYLKLKVFSLTPDPNYVLHIGLDVHPDDLPKEVSK